MSYQAALKQTFKAIWFIKITILLCYHISSLHGHWVYHTTSTHALLIWEDRADDLCRNS